MTLLLNIFIALIGVVVLFKFLEKDLGLFLLSLMIVIQYIWMFFSITTIENGVLINEQGRNGYFVGANIILFLFYISSLGALIFYKKVFQVFLKPLSSYKFKLKPLVDGQIAFILIFLVLFVAYFNLLSSPIPLFSERVDKFNFWDFAKYPQLRPLIGNIMAFVGFGSALLYRQNKVLSVLFVLLYIIYLILMGQKFTGFLISIYGILLALFFSSKTKINFKLKWVLNKYVLGLVFILFALVYYKYSIKNPFKYLGMTPLESVFYRAFSLQGHVFWGVSERYVYMNTPNTWNIGELWNGMHHLMLDFWPWSYEDYLSVTSRGVSWTNGYPSILLRIFPLPLALVANVILLFVVGFFQELLKKFITNKSYILSIVFFQLLTWVSYAYTMSYFKKLIIPFALAFIYMLFNFLNYKTRTE